ncbi:MAG: TetR family transcriptional regulator, partial [Deltaproteobacteria bacterium]
MGRPSNAETRRAQLADALVGLLAEGSFEQVTTADLARGAGLAPGLVHHYFGSKEEVLTLAVERLAIELELRLTTRLRAAGSEPLARVEAIVDSWLATGPGANPRAALTWVTIGDEARRRADVRGLYLDALGRTKERLAEEIARALPPARRRRARSIAEGVLVVIEGALRVGAAGGIEAGTAAPLARHVA